jgi:hypothetical protein
VIKALEAQVGQFLLGYKCPVSYFLPGRAKDLPAPLYNGDKLADKIDEAQSEVGDAGS